MLPSFESLIIVTLAGCLLAVTPGPSMFYVLSRSMSQNTRAGLASSAGLAVGGICHALAAAFGLASIIAINHHLFLLVQIFGVTYLAYLGFSCFKSSAQSHRLIIEKQKDCGYQKIFWQGVLVEISNPKTILFFVAFIPSLLSDSSDITTSQLLILGMLIPITALPSDLFVSLAGGKLAQKLKCNLWITNGLNKLSGIILIGLAIRLLID
ncbi:LysE family translocator [Aliikangiella maris]|uniref:LysE family translocator n=2 Tax=Aliikangiella maris TaxID=3162458 RepID=A0ABV2BVP3_9GAMM